MKLNNILLVPTDFSDVCHNAIDHAVKIANEIKFKVLVYHVINKDSRSTLKGDQDIGVEVSEKLENICNEFKLQYNNVEIDYVFESGNIFDLIHKKAEEVGANMIILGTHGKTGFQKLFGSYALKVITQAQVPTMVVQKRKFQGVKNILFPVNSFTEARQKVGYAKAVAARFDSTFYIYKEKVADPDEYNRIEIISNQIAAEFKKEGINYIVKTAEKKGDTAKQIISYAVEQDIDIAMIVTEPSLETNYFNLGPWNEKIMFNDAQFPVICINPVHTGTVYFDI